MSRRGCGVVVGPDRLGVERARYGNKACVLCGWLRSATVFSPALSIPPAVSAGAGRVVKPAPGERRRRCVSRAHHRRPGVRTTLTEHPAASPSISPIGPRIQSMVTGTTKHEGVMVKLADAAFLVIIPGRAGYEGPR